MTLTRCQLYVAEWLFVLGGLLALGLALGYKHYQDYHRTAHDERERLAQQAAIVERNLLPQLEAANQGLLSVIEELHLGRNAKDGKHPLNHRLEVLSDIVPGVRMLLLVDTHGKVTASNNAAALGFDVSKRDWFVLAAKNNAPKVLYLTPPFKSLVSPNSVALARSLVGPKGEFAGAVFAALHPGFAKTLLTSVVYTSDAHASLVHANGVVFVSTEEAMVGQDLGAPGTLFSRHRDSGQLASVQVGLGKVTGVERIVAQRTVAFTSLGMSTVLMIGVSRDADAVFAPWRETAVATTALFCAFALAAIGGLFLFQRQQITIEDAEATRVQLLNARERDKQKSEQDLNLRNTLVHEAHHHAKNSLQGIIGLLRQFATKHPQLTDSINAVIGQVQSVATVHGLQAHRGASTVRVFEVVSEIAQTVETLWQTQVKVDIPVPWNYFAVQAQEMTPFALVLHELILNAVKHTSTPQDAVQISLRVGDCPGVLHITIANTGKFTNGRIPTASSGSGLQLAESLLPNNGATLSHEQVGAHGKEQVLTHLILGPPLIVKESHESLQHEPDASQENSVS